MKTLCRMSDELSESHPALQTKVSEEVSGSKNFVQNELKTDQDIDPTAARHIRTLWADKGIQNTYENRQLFQLVDSCRYFFNKVNELSSKAYIPSYEDIIHSRGRTSGIVETQFSVGYNTFKIVDVGGQRNERKKWIHCFDGVQAVMFVAAINEYDQVLIEDGETNRLHEALDLFDEISNSQFFLKTSILLFLNKRDLFIEKLVQKRISLAKLFPEYVGGFEFEPAIAFLKDKFLDTCRVPGKRIYFHVTCATDTDNIKFTFDAVKDIIIRAKLEDIGIS